MGAVMHMPFAFPTCVPRLLHPHQHRARDLLSTGSIVRLWWYTLAHVIPASLSGAAGVLRIEPVRRELGFNGFL